MPARRIKIVMIREGQSVQNDCSQFASAAHAVNAQLGPRDIGIVVAPEYFLRIRGTGNDATRYHMPVQARDSLTTLFKTLSQQLTQDGATKMILLPGTIAWHDGAKVYNSAMMYVAGQDYRFDKEEDVGEGSPPRTVFTSDARHTERIRTVTVSGMPLRLGIEICSDHGYLRETIDDRQVAAVDIHILVSDAIPNSKHLFCARDGGLVIHSSTRDRERGGEVSERYAFDPATRTVRYQDDRALDKRKDPAAYYLRRNGTGGFDVLHRPRINNVFKRVGNVYTSLRKSFAPGSNVRTVETEPSDTPY